MLGQWRARHSLCMLRAPVRVSKVDVGDTCVVRTQMSGPLSGTSTLDANENGHRAVLAASSPALAR
jgi:hypothetical protein